MKPFEPLSVVQQLAAHLREAILRGELTGVMPGIRQLAGELGVGSNTVIAAVGQLEREGLLQPRGPGRRSRIVVPEDCPRPAFRVTLLPYEREDYTRELTAEIQQRLKEVGHEVTLAERSLVELGMKVDRVARMVKRTETDAWVVESATQDVLEWFVTHSAPTLALFGRFRGLPLAGTGPDKVEAFRAAARRLVQLGHRRIVLLQPEHMRKPEPGLLLRETLQEMETHGIITGRYNLPDWEQSAHGLRRCLDSLFAVTPPTALFIDRPSELVAVLQYLARRGLSVPRDVSLICSDDDPIFAWCEPPVSCVRWGLRPLVNRVVRWVDRVARGQHDRRQLFVRAEFVERGTVGPAPAAG